MFVKTVVTRRYNLSMVLVIFGFRLRGGRRERRGRGGFQVEDNVSCVLDDNGGVHKNIHELSQS